MKFTALTPIEQDVLKGFKPPGDTRLVEPGVFVPGVRGSREIERGLKASTTLRYYLRWVQEGCCADCGMEEWRHMRSFEMHRIVPGREGGLYTIYNTKLLCSKCHYRAERA